VALVLSMATIAFAWKDPMLTALCAPDENSYAWRIHLETESNYDIELSWDNFATPAFDTIDFGSAGDHDFTTARGGSTLYVRFADDHGAKASAAADEELCEPPLEPDIEIVKSNNTEGTIEPGTEVTYTYEVKNTGELPLTDVDVKDWIKGSDSTACEVDSSDYTESMNDDGILEVGETWTFTCTTVLEVTTENQACVTAEVAEPVGKVDEQSEEVEDCDENEVEVSASPEQSVEAGTGTPAGSIPNTSLDSNGSNPLPTILFSLVLLGSLGTLAYTNVKVVANRNR
jgi:uncharacterized repeat protein (TIGR01451 family)